MTHERLDDQVMMINLETGAYYALEDAAAECWTVAVAGGGLDAMAAALVGRYEVELPQAATDVGAFVEQLVAEGLVRRSSEAAAPAEHAAPPGAGRLPYRAPRIEKHDDLEELLLLDPIHDVGPEGWPAAG